MDWKRTKNLREKYSNPWKNMAAPLDHLPDAQGIKYRLQLNVYRFILEKYYGFVVSSMLVVCLHPDLEVPFVDEVPHMPTETCEIMALRCRPGTELGADVLGGSDVFGEEGPTFEEAIQEEEHAEQMLLSQPLSMAGPAASRGRGQSQQRSTAAKSRASQPSQPSQPHGQVAEEGLEPEAPVKDEADAEETLVPVEDSSFAKLKKRRLMPGAATSEVDFQQLFTDLSENNDLFQRSTTEPIDTSDTILEKVKHWREQVEVRLEPGVPEYLVRICIGVLAFGRSRQADIFLREHALIYWIAEGEKSLRFHSGDCYMRTPSGAFQQHRGVPPDHGRVQEFLLHVEGLFRLMPRDTQRTADGFLHAVSQQWSLHKPDLQKFLAACVDACLCFEGEPTARRARQMPPEAGEEAEPREVVQPVFGAWTASVAKTIMAVKKQLSIEITQDKLLHYMSEWCDTPRTAQAAVCYDDCAVTYEDELLPATQVRREDLHNCYVRIPHCIKGTVPQDVVARVQKFYAQTFWGNINVFRCCQAAQALAKRGINVVRVFIGLSGGGVGQSLYSTHLQAMYGHNFSFFDPQIWFNEEEMRKQVEQLNGCFILTGQETPGTNRDLERITMCIFFYQEAGPKRNMM